jgi:ElaB/YqjD/DUF883 family membrane-anchored ribosome-binding protein
MSVREAEARAEKERLSAAIEGTRAELHTTLRALRSQMVAELDWRAWVSRNPLLLVAIAAAVGWRIGRGRWL